MCKWKLTQAEIDRVMNSGKAILAMREALDDCVFLDDQYGDDDWRGELTGLQMRRWVRRHWYGGERGFAEDNDLVAAR